MTMTANEAIRVIDSEVPVLAKRRDAIGKAARVDMREAGLAMAHHNLVMARRWRTCGRSPKIIAVRLNIAASWRRLAIKHSNQWSL